MRVLYWDAFAGISGDMALGSLIALGADPLSITEQLQSTGLQEFKLEVGARQVQAIQATDIEVKICNIESVQENENALEKNQEKIHDHAHEHFHEHAHGHNHHRKMIAHNNRYLNDIENMIAQGALSERAKDYAFKVFRVLAEAEAKVHGISIDQVHFHEVGAVDSIVDIVGTSIALDQLEIDEILVSTLPWSHGFVECAHGTLPLPAPAAVELLKGFKFRDSGITGELVTPTGAALVRALGRQAIFPEMTLLNVGYGAGKNDYGLPSLLRAVLGER